MAKRIVGHHQLEVNKKAFAAAMEVFEASRAFPREETYSLTDQVRRASRSVNANLAEAWGGTEGNAGPPGGVRVRFAVSQSICSPVAKARSDCRRPRRNGALKSDDAVLRADPSDGWRGGG